MEHRKRKKYYSRAVPTKRHLPRQYMREPDNFPPYLPRAAVILKLGHGRSYIRDCGPSPAEKGHIYEKQ
ncbi:MAG TPA: hypothetical protein PLH98_17525, partial [Ruminococcus flavefaciens]|nr:hypothetical protein [Ruminococcus flavefaciens]